MRFLGIGDDLALGDMYKRIADAGHDVRAFIGDPDSADTLDGFVSKTTDWRRELDWIREAGEDGILIIENAHLGEEQDALRAEGFHIIGSSAFGDRLETDREFGQSVLRGLGLKTATTVGFTDFNDGIDYIRRHPRRYVFKLNGSGFAFARTYIGELQSGYDVIALIERHRDHWDAEDPVTFVLMEHLDGVEVGVGGYFNGEAFMDAVVIDWEHKRFFPGDLGELTSEMGTLLSYRHARPLFDATLGKMQETLREGRYVGYINLNTIVNGDGIWPLEFTCRFGNPGYAICDALHEEGWDVLFGRMIAKRDLSFRTSDGFAVGIVLTVPPFPQLTDYPKISKGLPVFFRKPPSVADWRHIHFIEVKEVNGRMTTAGEFGTPFIVTGIGSSVEDAHAAALGRARNIVIPHLRYRTDIGEKFLRGDRDVLERYGLWPRTPALEEVIQRNNDE